MRMTTPDDEMYWASMLAAVQGAMPENAPIEAIDGLLSAYRGLEQLTISEIVASVLFQCTNLVDIEESRLEAAVELIGGCWAHARSQLPPDQRLTRIPTNAEVEAAMTDDIVAFIEQNERAQEEE